jgi:uncharacterized membrane protein
MLRPAHNVIWNLFLAAIPVVLALIVARGVREDVRRDNRVRWWLWAPVLLVWLLFLPNTCYLLTEWRHYLQDLTTSRISFYATRSRDALVSLLVSTGFYIVYSGAGLLSFFLAIWPLERLARARIGKLLAWAKPLGFFLCSLGVYLGLISRFNTWDLVFRHGKFSSDGVKEIFAVMSSSFHSSFTTTLILGFAVILWVLYIGFDIWMDGFAWRMSRRRNMEGTSDDAETLS